MLNGRVALEGRGAPRAMMYEYGQREIREEFRR